MCLYLNRIYVDMQISTHQHNLLKLHLFLCCLSELFLQYCHGGLTINVVAVEEDVRCEDICAYNYLVFLSELMQGKEGYLNTEAQLIKEQVKRNTSLGLLVIVFCFLESIPSPLHGLIPKQYALLGNNFTFGLFNLYVNLLNCM